jgi:phosphatidate cytidylyltransferase
LGEKFEKIKIRALTIIVGIPIVLFIINLGGPVFYLTIALIAILGLFELQNILKKRYNPSLFLGILLTLFFLFRKFLPESFPANDNLIFTIIILAIFIDNFLGKEKKKNMVTNIGITLFVAIYIGHLLSFLINIRIMPSGKIFIIFALFATWMNDIFAYLFGVNFGEKHIFPNISPNKTLEGSIGGLFGGLLCGILFYFLIPNKSFMIIIFGLVAAFCGQVGDLFESIIKRNFNVKDSGKIIPGHGGILDFVDSILFSVPIMYYFLNYLYI